jgi:hypothetical protein
MTREDVLIYVDNRRGDNNNDGTEPDPHGIHGPVATADKAFSLLPPSWHGRAEIIFATTEIDYPIASSSVYFGMPIGPDASSLVLQGGYKDELVVTARASSLGDQVFTSTRTAIADHLIGAVLRRQSTTGGSALGPVVSIRGNSAGDNSTIFLQRNIGPISAGETFVVQRPAVTLRPDPPPHLPNPPVPGQALTLTSHDGRSPNLKLVGIKMELTGGRGLNLINIRALCDTCDFSLQRSSGPEPKSATLYIHTNSRIQGGTEEPDDLRAQAGVYIHSDQPTNVVWAVRGGILAGHLTFETITVRVSQGGTFIPKSLEARGAGIRVMAGGAALAEGRGGWGTTSNKGRIRDVTDIPEDPGDGLRLSNGGSINSPAGPINLDVYGCSRDGIHVDSGSSASFGPPGGDAGLVTSQTANRRFGMNIRNGSRGLVGGDAATAVVPPDLATPKPLTGDFGRQVALDGRVEGGAIVGAIEGGWGAVTATSPPLGNRLSSVRRNT